MIVAQIEDKLIKDIFKYAQLEVLTPGRLGIFRKGTKESIIQELNQVDINTFINIDTEEEYDNWFDQELLKFHKNIFPLYRENLTVSEDKPYSYSARLYTSYLKFICVRTPVFNMNEDLVSIVHPIISNTYISTYPQIGIKSVSQIKSRKAYYEIVEFYRKQLKEDLSDFNRDILNMEIGVEV